LRVAPPAQENSLPSDPERISYRLTVKSLTVRIPEALEAKLRHKAKADKETVSEIVRRALSRELEAEPIDFAELAAPYRGMFSGPADLSSQEGYGSQESR
jgi:hypothetical protein